MAGFALPHFVVPKWTVDSFEIIHLKMQAVQNFNFFFVNNKQPDEKKHKTQARKKSKGKT